MNKFETVEFNNTMNKILSNFVDDVQGFNKLIKDINCIVSGSTVLKAINNDEFKCNDLDIYMNIEDLDFVNVYNDELIAEEKFNENIDKMLPGLLKFMKNSNYKLHNCNIADENNNVNTLYTGLRNLKFVINLLPKEHNSNIAPKIQFIVCENYIETIKDFDLNINKNYWDGEKITMLYPKNVFTKSEKLNLHIKSKLDYYTLERIIKYRNRGYQIEIEELTTLLPKSIYNSNYLLQIVNDTFKDFTFEDC